MGPVRFHNGPFTWRKLSGDTAETCNADPIGWRSKGGCGAKAAYAMNPPLGDLRPMNCILHHQKYLLEQEKTGKIEWTERHLPDGRIIFERKGRTE